MSEFTVWDFKRKHRHIPSDEWHHTIQVYNDRGGNLTDIFNKRARSQNQNLKSVLETVARSNSVIALLDLETVLPDAQKYSDNQHWLRPKAYANFVYELCRQLTGRFDRPAPFETTPNLALCITKSDLLGLAPSKKNTDALLEEYFSYIKRVVDLFKSRLNIKAFITSAPGYFFEENSRHLKTNYEPTTQTLIYPDKWMPFNMAEPFFWIFESIERKSQYYDEKTYLNYPNTRILRRPTD